MKKRISFLFAILAVLVTTAMADNVISAEPLTIAQNGTAKLTVNLTNTTVVRGIQFTLTLPAGVTVQGSNAAITYVDGESKSYTPENGLLVSTTGRTSGWVVLGNNVSSTTTPNTYKFVMLSMSGAELDAGTGAIMSISFKADADARLVELANGVAISDIHLAAVKDNVLADVEQTDGVSANLAVVEFIKGDVNNDGQVDITDAVLILRRVVNKPNEVFIEAAGHVNGDNVIDITDAVIILQFIVHKIDALSRRAAEETDWDFYDPD